MCTTAAPATANTKKEPTARTECLSLFLSRIVQNDWNIKDFGSRLERTPPPYRTMLTLQNHRLYDKEISFCIQNWGLCTVNIANIKQCAIFLRFSLSLSLGMLYFFVITFTNSCKFSSSLRYPPSILSLPNRNRDGYFECAKK